MEEHARRHVERKHIIDIFADIRAACRPALHPDLRTTGRLCPVSNASRSGRGAHPTSPACQERSHWRLRAHHPKIATTAAQSNPPYGAEDDRQRKLSVHIGRLRSPPAVREICELPLLALPQGVWERLRGQRARTAGVVSLDTRGEPRRPVRPPSGAKLLNVILQQVRLTCSAPHPQRPRSHHTGRIVERGPRRPPNSQCPLGVAHQMVPDVKRTSGRGVTNY